MRRLSDEFGVRVRAALVFTFLAGVAVAVGARPPDVGDRVPSFVGKTYKRAQVLARHPDVELIVMDSVPGVENTVVKQRPLPGTRLVKSGTAPTYERDVQIWLRGAAKGAGSVAGQRRDYKKPGFALAALLTVVACIYLSRWVRNRCRIPSSEAESAGSGDALAKHRASRRRKTVVKTEVVTAAPVAFEPAIAPGVSAPTAPNDDYAFAPDEMADFLELYNKGLSAGGDALLERFRRWTKLQHVTIDGPRDGSVVSGQPRLREEVGGSMLAIERDGRWLVVPAVDVDRFQRPELEKCFNLDPVDETSPRPGQYVLAVPLPATCIRTIQGLELTGKGRLHVTRTGVA